MEPVTGSFVRETPTRTITVHTFERDADIAAIAENPDKFLILCKDGCVNYNRKWCCPPNVPSFSQIAAGYDTIRVYCYRITLSQWPALHPYSALKAANSILKSQLDSFLREKKSSGYSVLGSGACRACKPCAKAADIQCAKPTRQLISLEATGVDVDALVTACFGFSLQWYKRKHAAPEYTCVVGGVLHND